MLIKDIMSENVEVLSPDTLLNEVARKMHQRDCGFILITEKSKLVGVITDRDLVLRCMTENHQPSRIKAKDIMTQRVLSCSDSDTVLQTSLNMAKNKVRRLPVLNENKSLVGIISLGDLAANSSDYNICGKALGHICAVILDT